MKYSLKNEYKELLKEEIVNIERFTGGISNSEVWDIEIANKIITQSKPVDTEASLKDSVSNLSVKETELGVIRKIASKYSTISLAEIINFLDIKKQENSNFKLRIKPSNDINFIIKYLNDHYKFFCLGTNKSKSQIGVGELPIHLAFETENYNSADEPDAIIITSSEKLNVSMKSFRTDIKDFKGYARGVVRTGESVEESQDIVNKIIDINKTLNQHLEKPLEPNLPTEAKHIDEYCKKASFEENKSLLNELNNLKNLILSEHSADYVIVWTGRKFDYIDVKQPSSISEISIKKFHKNRAHFCLTSSLRSISDDPAFVSYQQMADAVAQSELGSSLIELEDYYDVDRATQEDLDDEGYEDVPIGDFIPAIKPEPEGPSISARAGELFAHIVSLASSSKGDKQRFEVLFDQYSDIITDKDLLGIEIGAFSTFWKKINEIKKSLSSLKYNNKSLEFYKSADEDSINSIFETIVSSYIQNAQQQTSQNSSYVPQGKVLKEVYSYLFKKKLISEGGLAGHMMHPYEALDMTPRQIIDRIKEYSTSQKIIEKVDGQNLFFTVEQDGTLMFARNKADMTHNDLVEKFTNHPAEVPFVTGGNAIKKGVDQWLSSAGAFGQQEILDIFHPDGEARSFINFEIMHKDHPNQLEYGENFIVFHSIVDFINGREAVYSSNNSQRLKKLISLMKQGIESLGYTLASNRTVDLNKLTNVQILSYIKRVNEIASKLKITDSEFLGDGVEKQIKKQLDAEGVNISDEAIKILYDFALYGEDRSGNKIKSKDFTRLMKSEDVKKLRAIDLTNANKAAAKVRRILAPFKEVFVDLGIDLLDGVPSAYMDSETDLANIDRLRDKLETAIEDLRSYMSSTPESNWDAEVNRLKEHYDKIEEVGIYNAVSTSVEGGVYDFEGDLLKVTGGFAPLNQILGAAYRDKKGIFPTFKQKFIKQESIRRSLKGVFNLIF